ncbi:hypothetical protein OUZ56_012329 [Daphnia magna]|uniref:Uncharacterized protein n=1 Tax=Daphnia magna TaxID=35525 RepID=A0ABQ9Z2N8_9CRUS|nr:hypothetical protein OUZ56_012329 [Daphnia magna]
MDLCIHCLLLYRCATSVINYLTNLAKNRDKIDKYSVALNTRAGFVTEILAQFNDRATISYTIFFSCEAAALWLWGNDTNVVGPVALGEDATSGLGVGVLEEDKAAKSPT